MNNKILVLLVLASMIFSPIGVVLAEIDNGSAEKPAEQPAAAPAKKSAALPQDRVEAKTSEESVAAEEPVEESEAAPVVDPGNVTVNFKGADIKTVLAYIAEVSGVDIVPAPDVKGVVDLKLANKPWKVALDIIVRNYGFAYEREGDIIRVVTIDKLKQEELASQVFSLNYSKAKDVVEALKSIVSDRGKVMYDDRTNTILVTDIPTNIYKIGQVIERLDKKTQQVLIEARIIETVLSNDEKLGVDWNVKFTAAGAKRPTTFPFDQMKTPFQGKGTDGSNFFPQVQVGTDQAVAVSGAGATGSAVVAAADFPTAYGSGPQGFPFALTDNFSFGTLDFSEFKVVLELIKSRANTDIVSNPRIATLNNTEALINVGETLNMPKYERNSSTGKMEITGYESKDLGIILKVTPHVNDNDEIVIDLAPEISDLLRYDTLDKASGVVAPVWSTRTAKTKIMVRDTETIFIGGLIKERDVDIRKKLPFLGDLLGDVPYVGLLVSKKEIVKQKVELIFFITVNLMKTDRIIKSSPQSEKAYSPTFKLTQEEQKASKKKRLNKRY